MPHFHHIMSHVFKFEIENVFTPFIYYSIFTFFILFKKKFYKKKCNNIIFFKINKWNCFSVCLTTTHTHIYIYTHTVIILFFLIASTIFQIYKMLLFFLLKIYNKLCCQIKWIIIYEQTLITSEIYFFLFNCKIKNPDMFFSLNFKRKSVWIKNINLKC